MARVDPSSLREQDLNARTMPREKFNQLVENVKRRGQLEELPYCAETEKGIEIVSGHHRVRAAKNAGLETIPVLLDRSGLSHRVRDVIKRLQKSGAIEEPWEVFDLLVDELDGETE